MLDPRLEKQLHLVDPDEDEKFHDPEQRDPNGFDEPPQGNIEDDD